MSEVAEAVAARPLWLQSLLQKPAALSSDARCIEKPVSWVVLVGMQVFKFNAWLAAQLARHEPLDAQEQACAVQIDTTQPVDWAALLPSQAQQVNAPPRLATGAAAASS